MNIRWKLLAVACVLFTAGCGSLTTKYPIGTTTGLIQDKAIFGTWKGHFADDKPEFYLHFLKSYDGKMFMIWVVAPKEDSDKNGGGAALFQITTTTLGTNHFINAVVLGADGAKMNRETGSIPLLYEMAGEDNLTIYKLDKDKTIDAIKSGAIAGSIRHHGTKDSWVQYDDVQITAEPAVLDAFFATPEAAKLFKVSMVLKRAE